MQDDKKFCTAITCMDGRTQLPVIEYLKTKFKAEYVDMITEAGPIKYLSEQENMIIISSIYERIDISLNIHFSKVIAVAGHHDCARNPAGKMEQIKQINMSIDLLRLKYKDCNIIGLYVNEKWNIEEV